VAVKKEGIVINSEKSLTKNGRKKTAVILAGKNLTEYFIKKFSLNQENN